MLTSAFIKIFGRKAGAVIWDPATGTGSFEYEPEFRKSGLELSPLKMPLNGSPVYSFPELRKLNTFKGLPGLLADVLPDRYGHAIINTWLVRQGRASGSLNPAELLCFIGKRGMGAMEFEPATADDRSEASPIELREIISIADQILSNRKKVKTSVKKNAEKALSDILKIGSSAGGARAKAVIAYHPQTGEVLSGQADAPDGFYHYIIKLDGVTDLQLGQSHGYGRVEYAYYLMAIDAGLNMSHCELLEENGRAHFMTRRFDRYDNENKLHMQSFCALQHFDFNDVLSYSYEQLFETMRLLLLPYPDAEQLFRRMCFNVMARNCDDHTKNFAFVMNEAGQWRLSPAFDICHAYRPGSLWVSQHALSINGKRNGISRTDLLKVGAEMNIKKANHLINEIAEVVSGWKKYARKAGVEKELSKAIASTLLIL